LFGTDRSKRVRTVPTVAPSQRKDSHQPGLGLIIPYRAVIAILVLPASYYATDATHTLTTRSQPEAIHRRLKNKANGMK